MAKRKGQRRSAEGAKVDGGDRYGLDLDVRAGSKKSRQERYEDLDFDREEEYHQSRDKVLLEGEDDEPDEDEEEEVLGVDPTGDDDDDEDDEEDDLSKPLTPSDWRSKSTQSSRNKDANKRAAVQKVRDIYHGDNLEDEDFDSEDEELARAEEEEALAVQKRLRLRLKKGLDRAKWSADDDEGLLKDQADRVQGTSGPSLPLRRDISVEAAHHLLQEKAPETLALLAEYEECKARVAVLEKLCTSDSMLSQVRYHTALVYLYTIAFYLVLVSKQGALHPETKSHPVLGHLVREKRRLLELESMTEATFSIQSKLPDALPEPEQLATKQRKRKRAKRKSAQVMAEPDSSSSALVMSDEDTIESDESETSPSSIEPKARRYQAQMFSTGFDDFGEATSLSHGDALEKQARKKSLRFHTAALEAKAARREAKSGMIGGDDDVPYKSRHDQRMEADRRRRLEPQESSALARSESPMDLSAASHRAMADGEDIALDEADGSDDEEGVGYYNLIKSQGQSLKAQRREAHDMVQEMKRQQPGQEISSEVIADALARRGLPREILKNKPSGMIPASNTRKQKKMGSSNPRLKRRRKYEKAQKKLASMGHAKVDTMGKVHYGGEATGVSMKSKSVKFV